MSKEVAVQSKFYTLSQNNSGGYFMEDDYDGICEYVIIEASSPEQAEELAYKITGDYSESCPCCGERWWVDFEDGDGKDVPSLYDKPLEEYGKGLFRDRVFIHYLDGTIKEFKLK